MGATSFYGLPYPDPGTDVNVPRDIQALADELETWKDGFTIPTGNLVMGTNGDGTSREVWIRRFVSGVQYEFRLRSSGSAFGVSTFTNGALQAVYNMFNSGNFTVTGVDGVDRPHPFATSQGRVDLPASAAANSSNTISFPANRFPNTPFVYATPYTGSGTHATIYGIRAYAGTATGYTIGCNVTSTFTVIMPVSWLAMQLTSTAILSPGPFAVENAGIPERTVTCHVADCENCDVPVTLLHPEDSLGMTCGPCGNPIEDMTSRKKTRK